MGLTFKVKLISLAHPKFAFGTCFVNKINALSYITCTLGMEGKKYGIKKLVVSVTNVVATYMQLLHGTYAILTKFTY